MPDFIPPMLATLIKEPFSDPEWLFEVKWDGFRALAFNDILKSRKSLVFEQFSDLNQDLKKIKEDVVLDGEIVILDEEGKSHFQLMQNYQRTKKGKLAYYVFDLLYKDGKDLRSMPLIERKKMLEKLLNQYRFSIVRYSDHILEHGEAFFKAAEKAKLEGIIGKRMNSPYQSKRSRDWIKVKTSLRQEVVIGGFTEPKGEREKFGALLMGVYNKKKELLFVGQVGSGYSRDTLRFVHQKLKPLIRRSCPFKNCPKKHAIWVEPKVLCEVSFLEWTAKNLMRHPVFLGLRSDKPARSVEKEVPEEAIKLTNLDKIYFPKEKITKGDLLEYYRKVAPLMLPYLKDRPIILHRYPNGIEGEHFYQKNNEKVPPGIRTIPVKHEGGKIDHYLLIDDLEGLLYAVNLGSIDLHPFMARCPTQDRPDYCVIDLDPHDIAFEKVIEAAQLLHKMLDACKIKNFCKTSGGNGLHILIPLHGKYTFEQSRQFAEMIGHLLHDRMPDTTSMKRAPKKRGKNIYIDCLQNRSGQAIVAPYAVRPRPGAKVSTPLEWKEVKKGMTPDQFTMKTVLKRLKKKDPLLPVLKISINLQTALNRLKKL
ncbi:MAG TPA: DNA ligase D [Chlamydiales bacterium]|nr:DNA ligase D [Chlamydiales bacterium]